MTPEEIVAGRRPLLDGWGARAGIIVARTEGAKVYDTEGKEYIDCTSMAYVLAIGANHPSVIGAAIGQLEKATHVVYSLDTIPLLRLTKKLAEIAPGDLNRVHFCLEGSLASETALKLAMRNRPGARYVVAFEHGYHGRNLPTMGDVRGPGLGIAVELVKDRETKEPAVKEARELSRLALERGVIFGISLYGSLGNVVKLKPPLAVRDEEIEKVLSVFEECMSQVERRSS